METRANYALLGGVTLAGVLLVMLFAMWLARASFNREFAIYDVVFDGPARGIGAGSEVRFNGIRVGEVSSLFIDPGQETSVVARVRIGASWPVRTDSQVQLEAVGLTALMKAPGCDEVCGSPAPQSSASVPTASGSRHV